MNKEHYFIVFNVGVYQPAAAAPSLPIAGDRPMGQKSEGALQESRVTVSKSRLVRLVRDTDESCNDDDDNNDKRSDLKAACY